MSTRRCSSHSVRSFSCALAISFTLSGFAAPLRVSADDLGTIGIVFRQIFVESLPNHRGPMAVMHVEEDSPAAKAGIHCSDFVMAVNGVPVPGRVYSDILRKEIEGPAGGTVRLTVARYDGSQSEITLVRAPYPPHVNPESDPFAYRVPGSWSTDPRYQFPLPFVPKLAYQGVEDVFFSPNFPYTDAPEYHSWLFFMWLDGTHMLSAEQIQSDMVTYFSGLAEERGQNYGFTPDLSKVSATYKEDLAASHTFGGATARAFSGSVTIWDTHGKLITVNSEVLVSGCGTPNHTVLFFGGSLEPRDGEIWKQIDAVRDTFRCSR
jgi:hypothetical protein